MTKPTLILSGTGKTGRRVAKRLAERGLPLRSASRAGATPFDWEKESTWKPALEGAGSVYVSYFPDLSVPGAAAHIGRLAELAVSAGVHKIVLLSGRGEDRVHAAEDAVRDCGARFTILRSAFFCQNFSEGEMHEAVLSGRLAFPASNVAEPFIDVDDLADVAIVALTTDTLDGITCDLTGPRLLTFADVAREISAASGRTVEYVPLTKAEYVATFGEHFPVEYVTFMSDLFEHLLDGHNAHLTADLARILGRPPRDFALFAREASASGAWLSRKPA